MARKKIGNTIGNTTANRSKKTGAPVPPPAVQGAYLVSQNGKPANVVLMDIDLEEEIRRRAYELYLQRRAAAGNENVSGDENQNLQNQDWLLAEREIRARYGSRKRHTA
jgi:hypothetical protein